MERIKKNVLFAETPYGIFLIVFTLAQFALLWVVSFYTEGNISPNLVNQVVTLFGELTCPQQQDSQGYSAQLFGGVDPAALCTQHQPFRSMRSKRDLGEDCDQFQKDWKDEFRKPHQNALFMLGYPHPMEAQTFVILLQVAVFFVTFHFLFAEFLTGEAVKRVGKRRLIYAHGGLAVLFFVCAAIETVYAAECGTTSSLCGFLLSGGFPYDTLMAGCVCPLMSSRIYTAAAFFWIFTLANGLLAYFIFRKMEFDESKSTERLFNFEFIVENRFYGKLFVLSLVVHFIFVWVTSFFQSDGSFMIADSTPISGFVIGFPSWFRGQTYSVLVTFVLFWFFFEFAFVQSIFLSLHKRLGLLKTRIMHGVVIFLMVTVFALAIAYMATAYGTCDYTATQAVRSIGVIVMSLITILVHGALCFYAKELFESDKPQEPIPLEYGALQPKKSAEVAVTVAQSSAEVVTVEKVTEKEDEDPSVLSMETEKRVDLRMEPQEQKKEQRHVHYDEVPKISELSENEDSCEVLDESAKSTKELKEAAQRTNNSESREQTRAEQQHYDEVPEISESSEDEDPHVHANERQTRKAGRKEGKSESEGEKHCDPAAVCTPHEDEECAERPKKK